MGSTIFQGQTVKALKDTFSFNGKSRVITGDSDDPRVVAKDAEPGSLFVRTTGQVFRKLDSGSSTNWVDIAKQAQAGKKNYLPDGDFESGDVSFVTTYDDVSAYIDGTGVVAPNITATRNTIGPRAGTADLVIYKDGVADATDQGVTLLSETIDLLDYGKDLFLEFNYDASDTNYTSGNYRIYAYDVTNSTIIPVVPIANLDDNAGLLKTQATAYAKVLCGPNTGQVRVSIHRETDTNPLLDDYVYIDEVILGPDSVLVGSVITEWQSYTPTWFGGSPSIGNGILQARYRRVGDSLEAEIYLYGGSTTNWGTTIWEFSLPTGLTMNSNKLAAGNDNTQSIGPVYALDATGVITIGNVIAAPTANRIYFFSQNTTGAWRNTIPFTWATNDWFSCRFTVPISEWSAGNLLSANEAASKTIYAEAARSAVQSIPDSGSFTQVDFDVIADDPFNLVNLSTDRITFPYRGVVTIDGSLTFAANGNGDRGVAIAINGSETRRFFARPNTGSNSTALQVQRTRTVNAGDYATLLAFQQGSGGPLNVSGNLRIQYEPDFSVFGVYGETENYRITPAADVSTVSADTYVDQPGASLTLNPGVWQIGYDASVWIQRISGVSLGIISNCAIRSASNVVQPGSVGMVYSIQSNADDWRVYSISRSTFVTITTPTTYKLSVRCSGAAASAVATIIGDTGFTGSLTNPDNNTNLWAKRIR